MYNRYLSLYRYHYPAKKLAPLLAIIIALSPFAIDTYLPSIPAMALFFNVDIHLVEASIPIYLIGFALGQLIGGPISDNHGRKVVGMIGIVLFFISSLVITSVHSIEQLWLWRFIQAFGGGFGLVICAAIVRDLYDGKDAAKVFTLIGFIMMIAPLIAPTIGSIMLHFFSWKAIFILLGIYAFFQLFVVYFLLPETKKLRNVSGVKHLSFIQIFHNYGKILKNKNALAFLLCSSFVAATLFAFLTDISFLYMYYYHVSESKFAWLFALNIVSMMTFNRINHYLLDYWQPMKILKMGLSIQFIATFLLLLMAIFSIQQLFFTVVLLMLIIGSFGIIGPNNMSCYMHFFPKNSGSANAVIGSSQYAFGALVGVIVSQLHNGTPLAMFSMMFISTLLAFISYGLRKSKE